MKNDTQHQEYVKTGTITFEFPGAVVTALCGLRKDNSISLISILELPHHLDAEGTRWFLSCLLSNDKEALLKNFNW